jgi:hypothetical protein
MTTHVHMNIKFLNMFQHNIFYIIFALHAALSSLISMETVKNYVL